MIHGGALFAPNKILVRAPIWPGAAPRVALCVAWYYYVQYIVYQWHAGTSRTAPRPYTDTNNTDTDTILGNT